MTENITEETIKVVQEMVHEAFIANAISDRIQSVLNSKFSYNNTANLIHQKIAHGFAVDVGDGLAETIEGYNQVITYGDISLHNEDYESVEDTLKSLKNTIIEFQNKLNMCAKVSFDNMDFHVFNGLMKIVGIIDLYAKQSILLVDKIELYKDSLSFDVQIDKFWIL